MVVQQGKANGLVVAYIGGGSRGWAWGFMKDLAMDGQMEGTVRLYDIDRKAAEDNRIIGEKISAHPQAKACWRYRVAGSLGEALEGADFVVISILPGTFDEMEGDVHLPEQYGIYQPVGDTTGPGGLVRGLRTVPMFTEIGRAIERYCPSAWVINYTNPMALCLRALYQVFPAVKAFGCCHEVFGTQKLMCHMLEEEGATPVNRQEIAVNVLGVNHFTWLDKASWQGVDLMPPYRRFAQRHWEAGYTKGGDSNWMNNSFESAQRVKFDLTLRYGLAAAAGDRHLAEFLPNWYTKTPETVRHWRFGLTTVKWRKKDQAERIAKSRRLVSGEEPVELNGSGEEGHLMLKALLGLGEMITNVNLPNRGQIGNLPPGTIVETNAVFRRDWVSPVCAGELPPAVLGLVMPHALGQAAVFRAATECDRALALQALLAEPAVSLTPAQGEKMLEEMLRHTRAYLPGGWGLGKE